MCGTRFLAIILLAHSGNSQAPNLQRILNLTEAQWSRIEDLNSAWYSYAANKQSRLDTVQTELLEERLRPEPAASSFGVRYFEIAAICQEATATYATYRQNLRGVLSADQRVRLTQLEANQSLLPAIEEAQALALLGRSVKDAIQDPDLRTGWRSIKDVETPNLPGCMLNSPDSIPVIADKPLSTSTELYPNLTRYLNLSRGQFNQMATLKRMPQRDLDQAKQEAAQLQAQLQAESSQPAPRVDLLGATAIRLEQICRASIAIETGIQQALLRVLSARQQEAWQALERAKDLLPVLEESQQIGLTSQIAAEAIPPLSQTKTPVRRIQWAARSSSGSDLPGCEPVKPTTWDFFVFPPLESANNPR